MGLGLALSRLGIKFDAFGLGAFDESADHTVIAHRDKDQISLARHKEHPQVQAGPALEITADWPHADASVCVRTAKTLFQFDEDTADAMSLVRRQLFKRPIP
jgi:hypothetical protein